MTISEEQRKNTREEESFYLFFFILENLCHGLKGFDFILDFDYELSLIFIFDHSGSRKEVWNIRKKH